jgi:hypothetical protein
MQKIFRGDIMKRIVLSVLIVFAVSTGVIHMVKAASPLSGKVIETMDSGGYTYAQIENNGEKIWVAMPKCKVVKGETITVRPGAEMRNFESKTLKRKFDSIIFSGGLVQSPAGEKAPVKTGSKAQVSSFDKSIKVEKAKGPDAYTVAEIHGKAATLNGKKAVVKGKVVKVSSGIMQRNWIHLQDGSGKAEKGTHDLVVTSQELPAVGDTITASGVVHKDKDFGSGYKYGVIMEDASIKK